MKRHLTLIKGGKEKRPIGFQEFGEAIYRGSTSGAIEKEIHRQLKGGGFDIAKSKTPKIGKAQNSELPQGTCLVLPLKSGKRVEKFLVVDDIFPNYLVRSGLKREQALSAAAIMARSLFLVEEGLSKAPKLSRTGGIKTRGLQPELWTSEFAVSVSTLPYRAAGTLAVQITGAELNLAENPPHQPHIAGLVNPLIPAVTDDGTCSSHGTFRVLHDIIGSIR